MGDGRHTLDPHAEERTELLLDGYELGTGFELAAVVGPSAPARAEVAARLQAAGPMLRVSPSGALLAEVEARLSELGPGRPILWIEASPWDRAAWSAAVSALNTDRAWLRKHVPGLVVLAGPGEALPLALERPDLGTMMGTVVRVREDPVSTAAGELRWLHLSDLHFSATSRWDRRNVLTALLEHLGELAGEGLRPDLVFVTGDVARSGQRTEYEQAEGFFRKLMDTLELDSRLDLFIVPGNHDVDRALASKRMAGLLVADLLEQRSQEALEQAFAEPHELLAVGQRLDEFYAFTRRLLGSARGWSAERPWRADLVEVRGLPVGVVQLNTAWASASDQDKGNLLVGRAQVQAALDQLPDARVKVALMHHPTGYLADFDESPVDDLLTSARGVDFILRGHLHETRLAMETSPGSRTGTHAAGATYQQSPWRKGFLLTELDLSAGTGRAHIFGYSERGAGHWYHDPGVYRAAKSGLWEFDLAPHLRVGGRDSPRGPETGESRAPEPARRDSEAAWKARVDGYRAAAVAVNNTVSLLGMPEKSRNAPRTSLDALFAPLSISANPDGAADRGGFPIEQLVRQLLDRSFRAGMRADEEPPAARMVLLGDPGSGKTTLTRFLAIWAAGGVELEGLGRSTHLVPLRVPFREMGRSDRSDLLGFLVDQAREVLSAPRDEAFFERLLREGRALVLCDGLDEVPPGERDRANQALLGFSRSFPASPMLVTSRVVGYDAAPLPDQRAMHRDGSPHEGGFAHLRLQPLTDEGLSVLVRRWYAAREPDARDRQRLIADLLGRLERSPAARQLARSPLLATLICLVHGQRATLPGQRARLFEEVVATLLHTWEEARGRRFVDVDPGRQRRYLEDLALRMQRQRVAAEPQPSRDGGREVTIEHDALVAALTEIACTGHAGEEEATVRHRMQRWVDWLTARTGLLVEQRPGAYGFLHLSLMEYLAACALDRQASDGFVEQLRDLVDAATEWHETVLLVMGRRADDPGFAAELHRSLLPHSPACAAVLVKALREEVDFAAAARHDIVAAALSTRVNQGRGSDLLGVGTCLITILRYSQRHADGVRQAILAHLEATDTLDGVPDAVLEELPALFEEPARAADMVARLAATTSDGDALYWLWEAAEGVALRWPASAAAAAEVQAHLFDHLAAPPRELFDTLETVHDGTRPYWCDVPAGTFRMGSADDDGAAWHDERPCHEVTLTEAYRLGAAPVTNQQYVAFDPTHTERGSKDHPAVDVSWYSAMSFCRWLSTAEWARGARLPTEAEWERACRAGTETAYWSGDTEADLGRVGWFAGNSGMDTHRVAELRDGANGYGLYDVHGNVPEWTASWFGAYPDQPQTDPSGPPDGGGRVLRGGSCWSNARFCRSAYRDTYPPAVRIASIGFRVLLPR